MGGGRRRSLTIARMLCPVEEIAITVSPIVGIDEVALSWTPGACIPRNSRGYLGTGKHATNRICEGTFRGTLETWSTHCASRRRVSRCDRTKAYLLNSYRVAKSPVVVQNQQQIIGASCLVRPCINGHSFLINPSIPCTCTPLHQNNYPGQRRKQTPFLQAYCPSCCCRICPNFEMLIITAVWGG